MKFKVSRGAYDLPVVTWREPRTVFYLPFAIGWIGSLPLRVKRRAEIIALLGDDAFYFQISDGMGLVNTLRRAAIRLALVSVAGGYGLAHAAFWFYRGVPFSRVALRHQDTFWPLWGWSSVVVFLLLWLVLGYRLRFSYSEQRPWRAMESFKITTASALYAKNAPIEPSKSKGEPLVMRGEFGVEHGAMEVSFTSASYEEAEEILLVLAKHFIVDRAAHLDRLAPLIDKRKREARAAAGAAASSPAAPAPSSSYPTSL